MLNHFSFQDHPQRMNSYIYITLEVKQIKKNNLLSTVEVYILPR